MQAHADASLAAADAALTALSPLDGRYAAKLAALRPIFSEYGFMHRRVQVELTWFERLSARGLPEFPPLSAAARAHLRQVVRTFAPADAAAIKAIEKTTNHDVKAVEYWIRGHAELGVPGVFAGWPELQRAGEFVHFACTSEDINNTSHALQLQAGRAVLLQGLDAII
ncbi:MAG: lyase family protein, partial [Tepidimonas ignava]|nr:lyase family protein [Tepidimonas ignava]